MESELSQRTYHPTQYQDADWEIIGDPPKALEFIPDKFEVINDNFVKSDPMFEDFGGLPTAESKSRWHLPDGVGYIDEEENKEPEIPTTALTDEEIEAIKKAAYDEGFAAASAETQVKIDEQNEICKQKLEEILIDVQKQIEENLTLVEKQCLDLALAISKKIIDGAVEINPEYIIDIINKAVALAGSAEIKTIKVSPQDYEFIDVIGVGKSIQGFQDHWQFASDPLIKAGCVIETSAGEIDYQLEPAWQRVQDQILKIVK